jgi:DNA invertase Pin-like site-specific DNA recombinase
MITAYAYLCCPPDARHDLHATADRYIRERLLPQGYANGGVFEDEERDAELPLTSRPAGKHLPARLGRGDAVVFPASLASFAGRYDLADTCRVWMARGVSVHFTDLGIDTTTAGGRAGFELLAKTFELEGERHGESIKRAFAERRKRGRPTGTPPYGFKTAGPRGDRRFVPDTYTRAVARKIVALRQEGLSWSQVYVRLLQERVKTRDGREWSEGAIRRVYEGELKLQAAERPLAEVNHA